MNVLAFDVTGPIITVGAAADGRPLGRHDVSAERGRGNLLEEALGALLGKVDWTRDMVEGLAVLTGPGSLTATRIGWATAAGWAQARGIPVTGWNLHRAHRQKWIGETAGVIACVHYRGDTFLLYDLDDAAAIPEVVVLSHSLAATAMPRILTGPGILGNRTRWDEYFRGNVQIVRDDDAIIGGDTLALWGEKAIVHGELLDLQRPPLDYGLPPDFRKMIA